VLGALFVSSRAEAQAPPGSTGGTLGKTDRELSGSQSQEALPGKTPKSRKDEQGGSEASPGTSVLGRWRWATNCAVGSGTGTLQLTGSPQRLSGSIQTDEPGFSNERITGIRVSDRIVAFTRHYTIALGTYAQTWSGTLSGSAGSAKIAGRTSDVLQSCTFSATRQ
jgi:hypothetical protein